ncbi:hypothetical protein Tco_0078293 [Tanacetum coccineum]
MKGKKQVEAVHLFYWDLKCQVVAEHRLSGGSCSVRATYSATPDCESHRHTRAWNYTLEGVSQSLPFALAFLHTHASGKEAKLFFIVKGSAIWKRDLNALWRDML